VNVEPLRAVDDGTSAVSYGRDARTGHYKWFVACVLCLAQTVAIVDRFALVLVSEPLRISLHLTDTQLGLLQGTGFSLLYCAFAIPLGAIADAANRRNLIMVGLLVWSLATAAAAGATSFATLFAARVLVGMGEACLIPAGMSLLVNYFPPASLARGTALFGTGTNFGLGLAFLGGGFLLASLPQSQTTQVWGLGPLQPWQFVFLAAGLLAAPVLILLCWVKEPPRLGGNGGWRAAQRGVIYLLSHLGQYAPFLAIGAATAVTGYALNAWISSVFVRIHAMTPSGAGRVIGLVGVIAGPLGTLSGGAMLDALRARGIAGAPLLIMAGGSVVALLTAAGTVYVPDKTGAIGIYCLFTYETTFMLPSLYAGMQFLTPSPVRGVAASLNMMTYSLAGLGIGPTVVGMISDRLGGANSLANAVVWVESAMTMLIVPTALLARHAYHRRALVVLNCA
jgi:predicted MFS family arabinose efflux permease